MTDDINFEKMSTESRNSFDIDTLTIREALIKMNEEDYKISLKIKEKIDDIVPIIEDIVQSFNEGGRLIYIGAGTSGRLGLLDAVECVPTFSVSDQMVQGLIAGGEKAFIKAVEGAEDNSQLAEEDLLNLKLTNKDIVVGIAASGRTPYVIGGLLYAKKIGAKTASISCNLDSDISHYADNFIEIELGPEFLTGSTRLKSGTCQKLILNMLSTISMIQIGKVYKNLMVDVKATNQKLIKRSHRIIMQATNCDEDTAIDAFEQAQKEIEKDENKHFFSPVKISIVMILLKNDAKTAISKLIDSKGYIRRTQNN